MSCVFDTYEQLMMDRINKALNHEEYIRLDNNEWSDLYEKFFINIYAQICDLSIFRYVICNYKTFEPVTLHIDPKQKNSEDPIVLHAISTPFLQWIFAVNNTKKVQMSGKCCFRMPSIFPIVDSDGQNSSNSSSIIINPFVSEKLINLYVFADHCAYHYNEFIKKGNADYEHLNIINRLPVTSIKSIYHIHDMISKEPNDKIVNYLKSHDALSIESKESEESYTDIRYNDIFGMTSLK